MLHTFKEKFNKCLIFLKTCPAHHVVLPLLFLGTIFKNLLLQMFISGTNSYKPHFQISFSILLAGLFFSIVTTLLLLCPTFLFKKSGAKIGYGMVISLLMTVLVIVDCYYYRGFSEIPSISILSAVTGENSSAGTDALSDSILSMISGYDVLYFVDYALLLLFAFFRKFYKNAGALRRKIQNQRKRISFFFDRTLRYRALRTLSLGALCAAILLFLPALHALGASADAYYDIYDSAYTHNTVFYFTPIGYHIANIVDVVEDRVEATRTEDPNASPDEEETEEERRQRELIEAFFKYNSRLPDNEYAGIFKDKNVILIQVESLENSVLGQSVEGVEIMPNLNKLIGKEGSSLYFPNIYDQVKSGNSSDCDLMINTSLLPTSNVFFRTYKDKLLPSMPTILRNMGYGTYYYNGSGPTSVWPYSTVYENVFGYVTDGEDPDCNFHMIEALLPEEKVYRYSSDENTFNFVLSDLEKQLQGDDHFFTQIILCSSHTPFRYDNLSNEENRNPIPNEYCLPTPSDRVVANSKTFHYLNTLHYVDAQIGIFLEKAEQQGLLEDTVVLIYGDHQGIHKYFPADAENIGEHFEDYAFIEEPEYHSVPLIIYDPSGKTEGKTFEVPGGQSDIMPTLLYLLGVDEKEYSFAMGKVLVNTDKNYALIANGTIIGEAPDEEDIKIIEMMYKISDYIVERDEFGYMVKEEREEAAKRAEQKAEQEALEEANALDDAAILPSQED